MSDADLLNLGGDNGADNKDNPAIDPSTANASNNQDGDGKQGGGHGDLPDDSDNKPDNNNSDADIKDFAKSWKDYIPAELKDRSEWNNIKDVSDLYKNYINAQQTISKSVRMPDVNSTPEDIAAFYTKLGKPQSKSDYTFEYSKKDNYIYGKESFDFTPFQEIADKANLTKDQYQALASAYIDINNENYLNYNKGLEERAAQELKTAESKLRNAWGSNYQTNINNISTKIKSLYPKETLNRMQNAGLFRDPEFLQSQLKLTKMLTGDTVFIEGNAVDNVPQTLQTLQDKRDKLMNEDYGKNREQVLALNKQIVQLKQAQSSGAAKYLG